MTHKLLILFLLSGYYCAAQTDFSAAPDQAVNCPAGPGPVSAEEAAQCNPGNSQAPAAGMNENPVRTGSNLNSGLNRLPTEASPRPGTTPVPSTRVIGPITTRSEFEMFAEDAAGRPLHV